MLKVRGEALDITCATNVTALFRTCRQLEAITGAGRSGRPAMLGPDETGAAPKEALRADADISAVKQASYRAAGL